MSQKYKIRFNGELINARITPKELEKGYDKTSYRKSKQKKNNVFRTNSRKLIYLLAKVYKITPQFNTDYQPNRIKNNENANFIVSVSLPELNISVSVYAESKNKANRLLALRVHRRYTELLEKN